MLTAKILQQGLLGKIVGNSDGILNCYLYIIKSMCSEAYNYKKESLIKNVINKVYFIYSSASKQKNYLSNYRKLEEFIEFLIANNFRHKFKDANQTLIWRLNEIIIDNLNINCPNEIEL